MTGGRTLNWTIGRLSGFLTIMINMASLNLTLFLVYSYNSNPSFKLSDLVLPSGYENKQRTGLKHIKTCTITYKCAFNILLKIQEKSFSLPRSHLHFHWHLKDRSEETWAFFFKSQHCRLLLLKTRRKQLKYTVYSIFYYQLSPL